MSLESKISYELNKHPGIKKAVKRSYQLGMYAISPKIKSEGNITCVSPDDEKEYFFGYYDKSPWDATGKYMLCMRANNTWSDVSPKEKAEIILIDTQNGNKTRKLAETSAWNVQQSCMLQWLGPDFSSRVLYNDCRNGKYCAVILDIATGKERIISAPVYTVSSAGKTALTLDFSRLYNLRPGYGYYNVSEETKGIALPETTAVWTIDLENNEVNPLLKYTDFASFQPRKEMSEAGSVHKVNHLMISPNGKRFMVLYRWFVGQRKYTRLITCNVDGSDMYLLSDDNMVSHCCWKNNEEILAFENKHETGQGYYLMKDKSDIYSHLWSAISGDGHPSYLSDSSLVVTDTYPNRKRIAEIRILKDNYIFPVARVFSPFKYDNDTRCDLHPRWNRTGDKICIDSVHEGHRGLYVINITKEMMELLTYNQPTTNIDVGGNKKKILFILTSCRRTGPVQQLIDNLNYLDRNEFEPYVLTLYAENAEDTRLVEIIKRAKHFFVPTSKKAILLNKIDKARKIVATINPDVIHTMGVFPDCLGRKLEKYPQLITIHCFIFEDYPSRFGKIKGLALQRLHLKSITRADKTVTCSQSLAEKYTAKIGIKFGSVQNGVNTEKYVAADESEKRRLRLLLNLPEDAFIFLFAGKLSKIKNQEFLLKTFAEELKRENSFLLLLGDGPEQEYLKKKYADSESIRFTGNVSNVVEYLQASDVYVSPSTSEGMPYGVLEAMAVGLPVILSDIIQHCEVLSFNEGAGYLYRQGSSQDLASKMNRIIDEDNNNKKIASMDIAHNHLSARIMSQRYEEIYRSLIV